MREAITVVMKAKEVGIIRKIEKYSVHDGPGIRTVVFVTGSPFNEQDNDESGDDFEISVGDILSQIDREISFYGDEEGGITISGGEPLMQPKFTYQLLKGAKELGINTAIETTGFSSPGNFIKIAGKLDYLLMDIKTLDNKIHKEVTGVSNEVILDNFNLIRRSFPNLPVHVRTPIIPGVNDNEEAIKNIYEFIGNCNNVRYELQGLDYDSFEKLKKYQFNNISSQLEDDCLMKGAGI